MKNEEWRLVQRTRGSTLKQLWARLRSDIWVPTERFMCDAQMMAPIMGGSPGVVDEQVAAGADDCESVGAAWSNNNTFPKIGDNNGSDCDFAARFTTVNVANGVTIDVCYMSVKGYAKVGTNPNLGVYFEDADDPGQIVDEADFNGRAVTSKVDWDIAIDWVNDVWYDTPSLVVQCKTVVDRVGWAANQDMIVFIKDDGSGFNDRRQCHSFDTAAADAPKLHIEYTAAAAGVPTHSDNYMRRRVVQG